MLVMISFVLFFALIAQSIWAYLFGVMITFFATVGILIAILIFNIVFFCSYVRTFMLTSIPKDKKEKYKKGLISKQALEKFREYDDPLFHQYHTKHKCISITILFFSIISTFKCNKMYYSRLYSFDVFKARWSTGNNKYYRKFMTVYCIIYLLIDVAVFCLAVGAIVLLGEDADFNMLWITLAETGILSFLALIFGVIELFKMKDYLKYNE